MRIITVGEAVIELERGSDNRFSLGFGGDAFHTAVHFARNGAEVAFATALGQDAYSNALLAAASSEGVKTDLVLRVEGRLPSLCLIETKPKGERHCEFWRETSPARQLFELPGWDHIAEELVAAELVYVTGGTLSLYSNVGLGRLLAALEFGRERGAKIAFDSNWRDHNWRGDAQRARAVYSEALKRSTFALPSFEEDANLWGDASPAATVERLITFGIKEIVVKNGAGPAIVHADGRSIEVPVPEPLETANRHGAGDAFNAAYLAARLKDESPESAALAGHRFAAQIMRRPDTITAVPKSNGGSRGG